MMEKLVAMRNSKKKGFTLIELIVVIAILAILAALAVPAYNGLKHDAAVQIGEANARTIYTACKALEATEKDVTTANLTAMLGDMAGVTATSDGSTATWTGTSGGYTVTATVTVATGAISATATK